MKVAIIGAGISGLYLSWQLAKMGHNVTVFERRDKIGKEVCSGMFSENILNFIPESKKLIQNEITHCLIKFPKKEVKVRFSKNFFVMNHAALDRLVGDLAEKQGVKIVLNCKDAASRINELKEEFDRIIGCDGGMSQIRSALGLKNPEFYLGIQVFSNENISLTKIGSQSKNNDFVEVLPTRAGFFWKIPRGQDAEGMIEYGVMEKPKVARKIFDEFLERNSLKFNIMKSAIIPNGFILPKNEKITLCGDAAGITKPWSGGGVVWVLYACDILLKNFPDFIKYEKKVKRFFLPRIYSSKVMKWGVYFLGLNAPWLMKKNYIIDSDFLV